MSSNMLNGSVNVDVEYLSHLRFAVDIVDKVASTKSECGDIWLACGMIDGGRESSKENVQWTEEVKVVHSPHGVMTRGNLYEIG